MATIRQWLNEAGFDYTRGEIVFHHVEEDATPGWGNAIAASLWTLQDQAPEAVKELDREFDTGYGGPQCPQFIADDGVKLYFPDQYDGSTSLVTVYKNIARYLDIKTPTPYPGG